VVKDLLCYATGFNIVKKCKGFYSQAIDSKASWLTSFGTVIALGQHGDFATDPKGHLYDEKAG
jgi:hypothetical protein